MVTKYLLLLLMSGIVDSRITIGVRPAKNIDDISVNFKGSDTSFISDQERKTFGIDDEALKKISEIYFGERCDHVFVKPPTPWGDVYAKYNWDIFMKTIRPIEARVLGIMSKPVAVASAEYVNNHNQIDVSYSTTLKQQVEETVEHTWSSEEELKVGQEIYYSIRFGAGSVGGSTSISYTSSWGKDTSQSRTVTLGISSTVSTTIPPKSKVVTLLTATQGTMEVEIDYEATLTSGDVFCNFANKFQGHHFYTIPIDIVQNFTERSVVTTEKISIGFYTSARMQVSNGTTGEEIPQAFVDATRARESPQREISYENI